MTLVKICGIRTAEAAIAAASGGADYLGFIFAPSRRQVTPGQVSEIRSAMFGAGFTTPTVGVFVDPHRPLLEAIVVESGIDLVQLSGDETPDDFEDFPVPIIKALPAGEADAAADILASIEAWSFARHILLDASDPAARGGTGKLANWNIASVVAAERPVLLAGGLTPDNVTDAVTVVGPAGVDVSSGVERNGQKDGELIATFIRRATAQSSASTSS